MKEGRPSMENRMCRGIKVREHDMLREFSELGVTRVGVCVGGGRAAGGKAGEAQGPVTWLRH